MKRFVSMTWYLAMVLAIQAGLVSAQTTEFTYQGQLQSSAAPANGNFDFEFLLFDSLSGGVQQGATLTRSSVAVTAGSFLVKLDFGANFPGANRFLEIRVRTSGGGAFTPLTPRQQISNSPYAVRSLTATSADTAANATNAVTATNAMTATNATQLGGVAADQYVITTDPRMTDGRPPIAGSNNYIQNQNATAQSSSFNIGGNGTAFAFSANQYNLFGSRILSSPGNFNLFAGINAGTANTTGSSNAFFGRDSGSSNTSGIFNSFFGWNAGNLNSTGDGNSFFGTVSGQNNVAGFYNSFFGSSSGGNNTSGTFNSFFGVLAGTGNISGSGNSFFGENAGKTNSTGNENTALGFSADYSSSALTNATAIGSNSFVSQSNSLVLGSINGVNGATTGTNVGIGTHAPIYKLHVVGENVRVQGNTASIFPRFSLDFTGGGADQKKWQSYATTLALRFTALNDAENAETAWLHVNRGAGTAITSIDFPNGNMNIGTSNTPDKLGVGGTMSLATLGSAGSTALCRNASNQISTCSSSARYKNNINTFTPGLDLIRKLRPVSFNWKDGGMADMGLVAEEVNAVEPLLTSTNAKGEVEGVKYDRVGVVLVNAVKEQQEQIEAQKKEIDRALQLGVILQKKLDDQAAANEQLRAQINALKALICNSNQTAGICKDKE